MTAFPPLTLFAAVPWLFAAPVEVPSETWTPGERIEQSLAPGQARRHVVALQPGEFVRVTVHQSGIDVALRVFGPDGVVGPEVDAAELARGWELASIHASKAGDHALEVRAAAYVRGPGRYVLESDAVRVAGPRDLRRLAAEDARARAGPGLGPRAVDSKRGPPGLEVSSEAVRQLPIAAEIFHELGETCLEAESLTFLALIQGWRNRLPDVLELHPRAMALWERCGDPYMHAEAHIYAAEGYRRAAQYTRAVETLEAGLAMARRIDARDLQLLLLTNVAAAYSILGDTAKTIRAAEEVLPLLRASDIKQGEAVALRTLAVALLRRGDFQQAAERAQQSLALRRQLGDRLGEINTLVTLGEVYLALGEPELARRYLEDGVEAGPGKAGNVAGWGRLFIELAAAHEQLGDHASALEVLERSLAHMQDRDIREYEPTSLVALGRFHLRRGHFDSAWEAGVEAGRAYREAGGYKGLADALELEAAASLGRGEAARAQGALEESLALRRHMQDAPGEAVVLHDLARVALAKGNMDEARQRLEAALGLLEQARTRILSLDLRSTWLASLRSIHETYVDTLMGLHRRDASAGWDVLAFEASESTRARSLLDLLAESRADIRGVDADLLDRERSLRERLGARLDEQLRALGSPKAPANAEAMADEIHRLSTEYQELRGRLRAASPRYAALTEPVRLSLEDVRSQVLDAETLLLEYALGAERSHLWVVGRDIFVAHELPRQAVIEDAVRRVRATIGRRSSSEAQGALAELARMVLGPARAHLANRRLLFVADGPLHHVPFTALPDAAGRPLALSHEIVNAPSAAVMALLRKGEGTRRRATRTLAVLADPVFDREDGRVRTRASAAVARDPLLERATRSFGFEGARLPRLPYTRREAQSILALAPERSRRLALDFDASRATLTAPEFKDYRIVHFATHGLLNDVRPELSGLVLSLVDESGRDQSGLLMAADVFNLELSAELVVLSGCRTALGKEIRGEGLIGLTRGFMYAGVPRVVASLWPVEDLATAELMRRFYEGMLGPLKLRPAAALRRAQSQMAGHRRWSAPYYWAGFQLQGDWR
jgi:CHAT domain-containing protein